MKKFFTLLILTAVMIMMISGAAVSAESGDTNVAVGASYTYSEKLPIESNGGDADAVKLTDGIQASTNSLWNGEWVVFDSNASAFTASVRVDLGAVYGVTSVSTRFLLDFDSGAFPPVAYKVLAGTDAENLTEIASGSYDNTGLTGTDAIEFEKVLEGKMSARYVEFRIEGTPYSWNTYMGMDEIIVTGSAETEVSEEESVEESVVETSSEPAEQSAPQSEAETESSEEQPTPGTGDDIGYIIAGLTAAAVLTFLAVAVYRRRVNVR